MNDKIQTPYIKADATTIKSNSDQVVSMIRKHLKVGCKATHALDIAASALVKDYQTLKGLSDKNFFTAKANFGTSNAPFMVEREIGFYETAHHALEDFREQAENCLADVEWQIFCNNEKTNVFAKSEPVSKGAKGYTLIVEVTGADDTDLQDGLEEVIRNLENYTGFDENETGSYSFTKYGDELKPNVLPYTFEEAIIDASGFITTTDCEDELEDDFNDAGNKDSGIESWEGDLMLVKWMNVEYAEDEIDWNDECVALDKDGKIVHQVVLADMLNELKKSDEPLHFCVVKKFKY